MQENARLKGEDAQARLQLELTQLKEQLALMQQRLFGASSEKRKPAAEATLPASARKQRGHGPRAQPQLPVQEVVPPLEEADKVCGLCGGALKEWTGQTEDSQEVSVVERHFVLKHYRRQKYRCPCGCAPVTAPAPPRLVEGGRYSVDFAVHVALQKYGFHLPLARQERMFERDGLVVDSQTLRDQLNALAHHLQPSYEALPAVVFSSPLIHADETHWYMLNKGPGKKWYAWTVACADAVYHRILPSRSGATAKLVLGDYAGVVMVDGYAAYQMAYVPLHVPGQAAPQLARLRQQRGVDGGQQVDLALDDPRPRGPPARDRPDHDAMAPARPWASRSAVPQPSPAQETVSALGRVHRAPRTTVERGLRRCVEL